MANLTKIGPDSRPIGETPVCVFHRATIPGRNDEPIERRGKGYLRDANQMQILTLAEFLQLGTEYRDEIGVIRSTADKAERSRLKRTTSLQAASPAKSKHVLPASGRKTRSSSTILS